MPDLLPSPSERWGATLETWVHIELRKALTLSDET